MIDYTCPCGQRNNLNEIPGNQYCEGCGIRLWVTISQMGTKFVNPIIFELFGDTQRKPFAGTSVDFSGILKVADNARTVKQLNIWLREAEQTEDYEHCATLRDEIRKLNQQSIFSQNP